MFCYKDTHALFNKMLYAFFSLFSAVVSKVYVAILWSLEFKLNFGI